MSPKKTFLSIWTYCCWNQPCGRGLGQSTFPSGALELASPPSVVADDKGRVRRTLGTATLCIHVALQGPPSPSTTPIGVGVYTFKLTPWRRVMSLLEWNGNKKGKTKKCNGNGQAEKGRERFISSLMLGGLPSRYCNGYYTGPWKEERKKLKTAPLMNSYNLFLRRAVGTMFHFRSSPPNFWLFPGWARMKMKHTHHMSHNESAECAQIIHKLSGLRVLVETSFCSWLLMKNGVLIGRW